MVLNGKIGELYLEENTQSKLTYALLGEKKAGIYKYKLGYITELCILYVIQNGGSELLKEYKEIDRTTAKRTASITIKSSVNDDIESLAADMVESKMTVVRLSLEAAYDCLVLKKKRAEILEVVEKTATRDDLKFFQGLNQSEKLEKIYEKLLHIEQLLEKEN